MTKKKTKAKTKRAPKKLALSEMMRKARKNREKNKHLLAEVRQDPDMAEEARELLCIDLRKVFAIPRELLGPSASRARYREHGDYPDSLVTYLFGMWAEFKRQAKIEDTLGVRTVLRNISKTVRAQGIAAYADLYVKPWDGAYSTLDMTQEMVTLMIGSDFHSKYIDPFGERVWRDVLKMEQPDGVRYNGDGPDFPQLSRHRQLPGHFALTVQDEVCIWYAFMAADREVNPNGDHKWLLGNHDIRLITSLADSAPIFCSLDSLEFNELFKLDEIETGLIARSSFLNPSAKMKKTDIAQNWETLADASGRPFWTTVHGFLCGKDAPAKHLRRFMTNGTNGHLHDPCSTSSGSLATGVLRWWQTGCMGYPPAIAAGYIPGPVEALGWSTTFLIVRLFPKHGFVDAQQVSVGEVATYMGNNWFITQDERDARERMLEI